MKSAPSIQSAPENLIEQLEPRLLLSFTITGLDDLSGTFNEGNTIQPDTPGVSGTYVAPLQWSLLNAPPNAAFNTETGGFNWVPRDGQDGIYDFTWSVTDAANSTATKNITVTILNNTANPDYHLAESDVDWPSNPADHAPILRDYLPTTSVQATVGTECTFQIPAAADADDDTIDYSGWWGPTGATFNTTTRTFTWTPTTEQVGEWKAEFSASDGIIADSGWVTINVEVVPPVLGMVYGYNSSSQSYGYIDRDGDGYGIGMREDGTHLTPDADDNDPSITDSSSALNEYGTVDGILDHLGYHPLRVFYIDSSADPEVPGQAMLASDDISDSEVYRPFVSWNALELTLPSYCLSAGDAIIFRSGTYTYDTNNHDKTDYMRLHVGTCGTEEAPIVIMGMPGERCLIVAEKRGIDFYSDEWHWEYINITNLTFTGVDSDGAAIGVHYASHVTITNVEAYNCGSSGIMPQYDVDHIIIDNVVLHDTDEHGVYCGRTDDDQATYISVTNSLFYSHGMAGIHFNQPLSNTYVGSNVCFDDEKALELDCGCHDGLFANNLFFDNSANAIIIYQYDAIDRDTQDDKSGGDFYNCVFTNNTIVDDAAILFSCENESGEDPGNVRLTDRTTHDMTFLNNVIVANEHVVRYQDLRANYLDKYDNIVFSHNLIDFRGSSATDAFAHVWGSTVFQGYSFTQWQQSAPFGGTVSDNVLSSISVVDSENLDFALDPDSPGIGLAYVPVFDELPLSAVLKQAYFYATGTDALCLPRTGTPDAGAFQYFENPPQRQLWTASFNDWHDVHSVIDRVSFAFSTPIDVSSCSISVFRWYNDTWNTVSGLDPEISYQDAPLPVLTCDFFTDMTQQLSVNGWYVVQLNVTGLGGEEISCRIKFFRLCGDATANGVVNFSDYLALEQQFNTSGEFLAADFNLDGVVNFSDYLILEQCFSTLVGDMPTSWPT